MTKVCKNPTKKYISDIYFINLISHFFVTGICIIYLILLVNYKQNNILSCKSSTLSISLKALIGVQLTYTLLAIIPTLEFFNSSNNSCSNKFVSKCHKNYANSTLSLNAISHIGVTGSLVYATLYLPYLSNKAGHDKTIEQLMKPKSSIQLDNDSSSDIETKTSFNMIEKVNNTHLNMAESKKRRNILIGIILHFIYLIMSRLVTNTFDNCLDYNTPL